VSDEDLDTPIGDPGDSITLREVIALSDELAAHPDRNPVTLVWHGEPDGEPGAGGGAR
jgi:hypothetical protein